MSSVGCRRTIDNWKALWSNDAIESHRYARRDVPVRFLWTIVGGVGLLIAAGACASLHHSVPPCTNVSKDGLTTKAGEASESCTPYHMDKGPPGEWGPG